MTATTSDDLRPLAELLPDLRKFAAENGYDAGALAHLRYRHVGDAARDGSIPVERINGRYHYRRTNRSNIAAAFGICPAPVIA